MFDVARRCELAVRTADGNGYVETDPTGRYGRFDEVLGKGAMKTVYRAFDELNGIEVAWNQAKLSAVLSSPEALERMYSEVHLLSSLHHDSIIKFQASWIDTENRTFNFITEMFTSGTLREYRQKYRRVNIRAIKSWARQILHGLVYLHGHDPPVIHRDLKCDNIFVNGHLGQVKIGDLGLAAVLRGSQCAHSVIGTPEFMAPELYEEEYNELVDIYSFGMCVLEMVTTEYPYKECSNPAQIYKKVSSGKLPDAFHRVQDPEAKRFIGKCLENVGKRSTAKELLLDPFLVSDDRHGASSIMKNKPAHNRVHGNVLKGHDHRSSLLPEAFHPNPVVQRADMTITGKMNPEDDSIILKVQITDKDGATNNIYFPFDMVADTPSDVANEMVKELEITHWEPSDIAEMIAHEISLLVPGWKEGDGQHVYNYGDEEEDGCNHPFYAMSSPTSSHGSLFGAGHPQGGFAQNHHSHPEEWLRDNLFIDDDDNSSTHSGKYSALNYASGNEQEADASIHQRDAQPSTASGHRSTRFGPDECSNSADVDTSRGNKLRSQLCSPLPEPSRTSSGASGKRPVDNRRLMRNRSMVDVRSQLLHRTLVEELNKRMFKTVDAVESIGFQMPYDASRSASSSPRGNDRKQKQIQSWRRV